ncbi:hypothetical protein Hanom_Chr14g01278151 [Helianthus anomalus]
MPNIVFSLPVQQYHSKRYEYTVFYYYGGPLLQHWMLPIGLRIIIHLLPKEVSHHLLL